MESAVTNCRRSSLQRSIYIIPPVTIFIFIVFLGKCLFCALEAYVCFSGIMRFYLTISLRLHCAAADGRKHCWEEKSILGEREGVALDEEGSLDCVLVLFLGLWASELKTVDK